MRLKVTAIIVETHCMRLKATRLYETIKEDMPLYKNKYRVESVRLKNYDYSQDGFYFVTICTKKRICYFGDVVQEEMKLNEIGKIVNNEWERTEQIRKNVLLDTWIIMPNHLHGIIVIDYPAKNVKINDKYDIVETHCNASLQQGKMYKNKFGPQSQNLSAIIRGFKGAAKNIINQQYSHINFAWQELFYDHIIRNQRSLAKIQKYINNNPAQWEQDRNNPEGLYM